VDIITETIIQLLRAAYIAHALQPVPIIDLVQAPDGAYELPRSEGA